jgi:hypothetical protein
MTTSSPTCFAKARIRRQTREGGHVDRIVNCREIDNDVLLAVLGDDKDVSSISASERIHAATAD